MKSIELLNEAITILNELKTFLEEEQIKPKTETKVITLEESSNAYANCILELLNEINQKCSDSIVLIEQKLDYSRFIKDGF